MTIGDSTSSGTDSSAGDLNPSEGVSGFSFLCGTSGDLMSSPGNLGGLSLISLSCISLLQGDGGSKYFSGPTCRGGRITFRVWGNANGRVTGGRVMCFDGTCDVVPRENGFCGNTGCIGVSGTGCGVDGGGGKGGIATGVDISKMSALLGN